MIEDDYSKRLVELETMWREALRKMNMAIAEAKEVCERAQRILKGDE